MPAEDKEHMTPYDNPFIPPYQDDESPKDGVTISQFYGFVGSIIGFIGNQVLNNSK